ncbi:beta-glucosidase [Amycolatopsis antarctica]|uniref:beta-N-acetylhexosaminidase n=1 Tax=Amycolatopsis antarctica TaxID=1854586 RepID=A0A263D702_9PSEU|nr:glycoside hydrolase family 3 N-terminal domain-containing protein [Amycolatopsis antarctica]OZM73256.1 beta-glucosidase [Amycolatopsis antarctica]
MTRFTRRPGTTRLLLTTLLGAALAGGVVTNCGPAETGSANPAAPPPSPPPTTPSPSQPPSPSSTTPPQPQAGPCEPVVAGMSPRQRLAQLVVVGVEGDDTVLPAQLARDEQVGGIFIGGNATALLQGDALAVARQASTVPMSVAVDDEGGRVQRIDELDGDIPSAREMARTMTSDQVRDLGRTRGEAMAARGVTVDYAPVTDVSDQPGGSVIGDRAFSDDPAVVREYALAFAQGLREAGVAPVLKHFPGHGGADGDSHQSLVSTPPLSALAERDLVPYRGIGDYPGVSVMVGHLDVPELTNGEPASLAEPAYSLLRGEFGFTGPVVTDDLGAMKAIADRYTLPEAVLKSLQAGADQALWSSGGRVGEVLDRLEAAQASGELPPERVRESLDRVLIGKNLCG